jgi:hypothetical protein
MKPFTEFWVVMFDDGTTGTQYNQLGKAQDVAELFAKENPGRTYYVLKATMACKAELVTWVHAIPTDNPW